MKAYGEYGLKTAILAALILLSAETLLAQPTASLTSNFTYQVNSATLQGPGATLPKSAPTGYTLTASACPAESCATLSVAEARLTVAPGTGASSLPLTVTVNSAGDLGKWVDARQQGTYGANYGWLMRDDSGNLNVGYSSSGQPFDPRYAPDWRATTIYTTDVVRYQVSTNNGETWSPAQILIKPNTKNGQDDLTQGGCTNSLIYYDGAYYLYFEDYASAGSSGLLELDVAKADNPAGPYRIWTAAGWQRMPTTALWKPVLRSNITTISGGEQYAAQPFLVNSTGNGIGNKLWGAGLPRVTQKDGVLYLTYYDSTYFYGWADSQGSFHPYNPGSTAAVGYLMTATSTDPTAFTNAYGNRLTTSNGSSTYDIYTIKYFPELSVFVGFINDNGATIDYRTSSDGSVWSDRKTLANLPSGYGLVTANDSTGVNGNALIGTVPILSVLTDKNGHGHLSDLYFALYKTYNLTTPPHPVGWPDAPSYKWYYGGNDMYGIKLTGAALVTGTTPTSTTALMRMPPE